MGSCPIPTTLHMVAIPMPLRGHLNPMLHFCNAIARKKPDFLITIIVTKKWLNLIRSDSSHSQISNNIRFATIPNFSNVANIEKDHNKLIGAYMEDVSTKMKSLVEHLLDRLEGPNPRIILHDAFVKWGLDAAHRRNIPAASFSVLAATYITLYYHWGYFLQNGQLPSLLDSVEDGRVTFIPGIPSIRIADIQKSRLAYDSGRAGEANIDFFNVTAKADYLVIHTVYELESEALDSIRKEIPAKTYTPGLAIPLVDENDNTVLNDHISWLDTQPRASVLYISQGSFVYGSNEQVDEHFAGICDSGVRFFWITRDKPPQKIGEFGLIVEWCDQLRVLCHPSIGGFWSHCGWNSVKEAIYAGLPILACPNLYDQFIDRKLVVEDWKTGWNMNRDGDGDGKLMKREKISGILKAFMDPDCEQVKGLRKRAAEISEVCRKDASPGGASDQQLDAFIKDISK